MLKKRTSDEPWNEQTFFAHTEGCSPSDSMGLRRLFAEVILRGGGLSIVWGKGDVLPRFIVRRGESSADFVSGWATGAIGIQVASLRVILGQRQNVLDELAAALDVDWSGAKEPTFDATHLESEHVATAMSNLLAVMAGVDGTAAAGGYKIAPR
jgi:hypothetical protein